MVVIRYLRRQIRSNRVLCVKNQWEFSFQIGYIAVLKLLTNFELTVSLCWFIKSFKSVTSDSKDVILFLCSTFGKFCNDGKLGKLGSDQPPLP